MLWCVLIRDGASGLTFKMNNIDEVYKKIGELRTALKENCTPNTVRVTVTFTAEGFSIEHENRTAESLKRDSISMRNMKGEFI